LNISCFLYIRSEDIDRTDPILYDKYQNLANLINESMSIVRAMRPNCDKILNDKHLWAYDFKDISNYLDRTGATIHHNEGRFDIDKQFTFYFIQSKFKFYNCK